MPLKSKLGKKRFRRLYIDEPSEKIPLGRTRDAVLIKDHVLYPSSRILLKRYMRQARRTGMIRDEQEYKIGIKALSAAAMIEADKEGEKYVTPKHVAAGWARTLRVGGGNCPPHRCLRSSVINRVEELRESLPYFGELISPEE